MPKIVLLPFLFAAASLIAGLYGVLHNQISYTVSHEYFSLFKFNQFAIEDQFRNRIGASVVGFYASWWMGALMGIPVSLAALFASTPRRCATLFLGSTVIVVIIALTIGLGGLVFSPFMTPSSGFTSAAEKAGVIDPSAFFRAGTMHDFSYLGSIVGMVIAIGWIIMKIKQADKKTEIA
ncbi:MAG: hypothetical protein AAGF28_00340 [Pseudomonadota bacterium]